MTLGNGDYGTIIAIGTPEDPIVFTSNATIKKAGDWNGFWLYEGANGCKFEYCTFEYGGGYSEDQGVMNLRQTDASFKHCTFTESAGYGIEARGCGFTDFENNTITKTANKEIKIDAGYVHTIGANNVYDNKGINVAGGDVETSGTVTWLNQGVPYILSQSMDIGSATGTTLQINPGVTIKIGQDVEIEVAYSSDFGTIKAMGTATEPIVFTSNSPSPTKGDWEGIWLYDGAAGTEFNYCTFEYGGGYTDDQGTVNLREVAAAFDNCTFSHSGNFGIELRNCGFTSFSGNTFIDNLKSSLKINANYVHTIDKGNSFDDEIFVNGGAINTVGTIIWSDLDVPYLITQNIDIGSETGTTLVIDPGVVLKMSSGIDIEMGYSGKFGSIRAEGTSENPIIITSASAYPTKGDWDGIWFYASTMSGTIFDYCEISYGGGYSQSGNFIYKYESTNKATISNSTISYSETYGVYKDSSVDPNPTLTNITYIDNTLGDTNF